jgi:hypothetical protein
MEPISETYPKMMQGMLQDRFGLKSHWDKKEASVYTLTLSKRVPAMKETTPLLNLSMQDFQTMWIWAAMAGGAEVPPQLIPRGDGLSLDSFVNSLKDVGLQLERGKGPVDILVVDSVQKKPTEN